MSTNYGTIHLGAPNILAKSLSWSTPKGESVFQDLSFTLGKQHAGLIGDNGSGKTTLLRLIVGELKPPKGVVEVHCRIGYLPQQIDFAKSLTVGDALGISSKLSAMERIEHGEVDQALFDEIGNDWNVGERAAAQLGKFGLGHLSLQRPLQSLSGGESTRIVLASLLLANPDYLILDEPTNNLDLGSREYLYELVKNWHTGCLIVSHDRALLELTDEILELSGGKLRSYGASFPEYQRLRQVEDSAAERAVASADQAVKREKAHAQRSRERQMKRTAAGARKRDTSGQAKIILGVWKESSEKTTARLTTVHERRVQEAKSRLEEAKTKIRQENTLKLDLPASTLPAGKVVLEVRDLKYDYPDSEQSLLGGVSFTIVGPERVAICGDNGSGKTTLLKIILGQIAPTGGSISLGVREVVYLPQNTFALDPSASVLANFQTLSNIYNDGEARQRLSRLLFFGDDVYKPVSVLSGGERIKLALGGVLSSPTQVQLLVIDEPTNHLDLNSIEQLESALQQYQGALIVVSHDMSFLRSIGVERELHIEREH